MMIRPYFSRRFIHLCTPLARALAASLGLILAACSTPTATHYYTLNPPALASQNAAHNLAGPVLLLTHISLPEKVDRPQLVLREGSHQLRLLEQERWAEPLPSNFAAALAGHLQSQLPSWQLQQRGQLATPQPTAGQVEYQLWLDVVSFDSQASRATLLEARWSLRNKNGKTLASGQSHLPQDCNGCDIAGLVAAHQRSVQALAQEIAVVAKGLLEK